MNKSLGSNITYLLWGPDSAVKTPNGSITRWATKILQTLAPKPIIYVTFENGHSTTPFFRTIWKLENNGSVFDVNKWLTTGFHSVVTALNFCDSLTIFGLDAQKSCEDKAKNKIKVSFCQTRKTLVLFLLDILRAGSISTVDIVDAIVERLKMSKFVVFHDG